MAGEDLLPLRIDGGLPHQLNQDHPPARLRDPDQFTKLGSGIKPWWPGHDPPEDMAKTPGGDVHTLYEISENHWIGCWRTDTLEGHTSRRPDLPFRKTEDSVHEVVIGEGDS